jgi:outer membrane protein OmpA-like peptidoglycan-associated protein
MKTFKILMVTASASLLLSSCANLYLSSGKKAYEDLKYREAINYLETGLARKEDESARKVLADSYFKINDYSNAAAQYERTVLYAGTSDNERINYGKSLMSVGKYDQAKEVFAGITSRDANNEVAKSLLASCKKYESMKQDSAYYSITPVNIPGQNPVYSAVPYNDGLIVTSSPLKGDKDPYTNNGFTDLFFTKKDGAIWSDMKPLENINSKSHDAIAAVSPNGQTMIFTRSFQLKNNLAGNDKNESPTQLYQSKMGSDGKWSKPEILPFCDVKYMYAHPSFSPDGNSLYFASDMPGGKGGFDIYETKLSDSSWGIPQNLGSDINTKGDEVFPSIYDENTLYFSSDARNSLGGLDILKTVKTNGAWNIPQHLSYPINTGYDDFSLVMNKDGKTGYLSSDRSGSDRVYAFEILDIEVKVEGLVADKETMLPLGGARVTVQNLTDGTEKVYFTDANGKFVADLEPNKEYKVKTDLDGYFSDAENISTKGVTQSKTINKVVEMPQVVVANKETGTGSGSGSGSGTGTGTGTGSNKGQKGVYDVPNIFWDYNKWDIREDAIPYLESLVTLFRNNQNLKFEIRSHCDSRGSYEFNDDLSDKRAKEVVEYLVKRGVPRSIVMSKGYGERQLLNECGDGVQCDESKHQENRRTEFIVTGVKK